MNGRRRALPLLLACCLAALAGCSPTILEQAPGVAPPLPDRSLAGAPRYEVVPADTRVYARVYRGGRLEKLGHNHVVLFNDVQGYVFLGDEPDQSLFDVAVAVADAEIDPPALRAEQGEGFETELSEHARARTRQNMLKESLLDAAAYPYVMLSSTSIGGSFREPRVTMAVTIKNVTRRVTIPVRLEREGDRLVASGEFELLQSDYGIEPFSALGGALKVEDRVELVFTITAEASGPADQ
jgi:polyisoprenoid-binding protein YceI